MKLAAIPILMYHQVTPAPLGIFRKYSVLPDKFAAQMRWLSLAGYRSLTMEDLLRFRQDQGQGHRPLPGRSVIITFDDGYEDCLKYAVPVLEKYHFTAIFYIPTALVGQSSLWLKKEKGIDLPIFDWSAAQDLLSVGFEIGSHSVSHKKLAFLSIEECRQELTESKQVLEEKLGCPVHHLAYPYGSFNNQVKEIAAEAGYKSACTVEIGLSPLDEDLLALHRVPVLGQDYLFDFICRLTRARPLGELLQGKMASMFQQLQR